TLSMTDRASSDTPIPVVTRHPNPRQLNSFPTRRSSDLLKKGRCGTMTHDDKRNGTATLFAALNVLDGKVIGQSSGRHRHQEFLRSEEHTSELQSPDHLVCRLLLEKKNINKR